MGLAPLRRLAVENYDEDDGPFEPDLQVIDPTPRPHDQDWVGTIYYDPEIFPIPSMLGRVEAHYARTHPGRRFVLKSLSQSDLEFWAPNPFGKADRLFWHRGFVSDIEVEGRGRGGHSVDTRYQRRNEVAAAHQLANIKEISTINDFVGTYDWQRLINNELLVGLIGGDKNGGIPLVEHDGMLLPSRNIQRFRSIHLCYSAALKPTLDKGRSDEFRLAYALPEEIAIQGAFEVQHANQLFDGAWPNTMLLWQTQVLAALRKAAWKTTVDRGLFASSDLFEKEKASARQLIDESGPLKRRIHVKIRNRTIAAGGVFNPHVISGSVTEIAAAVERDMLRLREGNLDPNLRYEIIIDSVHVRLVIQTDELFANSDNMIALGFRAGENSIAHHLTMEHILVAALHGATYMPDIVINRAEDLDEPVLALKPLASWIGSLKRRRYALLDRHIADLFISVAEDDMKLRLFEAHLSPRLCEDAWGLIEGAVIAVGAGSDPIHVVYEWTRDLDQPHGARRGEDAIEIRGPMLDFPIHEVALWNGKAEALFRQGGLVLS